MVFTANPPTKRNADDTHVVVHHWEEGAQARVIRA